MDRSLDALFRPRGVAVLGASAKPLTIGHRVVRNLLDAGYRGLVVPVTPAGGEVCGLPAVASVEDAPGPVDLANVALRADRVPGALESCGRAGVRAVIVHSAGFAEAGPEGAALQARCLEVARHHGMRLVGPNAQGVLNGDPDVRLYASFTFTPLVPGPVTVLAQSGGIAELLNLHLRRAGVGIRRYASPGNASDVDLAELLADAARDPGTRVVLLHLESVRDLAAFREAAQAAFDAGQAVLVLKPGRSEAAARAVASHTGNLAAGDRAFGALLDRVGALRMDTVEAAVHAAAALARQPLPRGRRVAVLCNAGGPGIVALDESVSAGLVAAPLSPATREALVASQSPYATVGTLVDVAATAGPEAVGAAVSTLLEAPEVDGLVLSLVTPFFVDCEGMAGAVVAAAAGRGKPVVANLVTDDRWAPVEARLRDGGLPVTPFPEQAARALAALADVADRRARPAVAPPATRVDAARVRRALARAVPGPDGWLCQKDAWALLRAARLPCVRQAFLEHPNDADESWRKGDRVGYPAVLKADVPGIVHKTEAGAVATGLAEALDVEWVAIGMAERFPGAPLLLQRQVRDHVEMVLGLHREPSGLAVTMAGFGGTDVEADPDVVVALAPLDDAEALRLLSTLRGRARLGAWRGAPPRDLAALADAWVRLSLLADLLPGLAELDLNPVALLPSGRGAVALDVRVRVGRVTAPGPAPVPRGR